MQRDESTPSPSPITLPADGGRPALRGWRWSERRDGAHTLLVIHGLGDHGRALPYARLAAAMAAAGHGVVSFDQRGHGDIPSRERGRTRLATLVADAQALARALAAENRGPVVLVGLSMGALVALRAAQCEPAAVRGVVAAAAPLGPVAASPLTVAAARVLGALWPGLTLASGIDPALITADAAALAEYTADPRFHTRVGAGLGCDLLDAPGALRRDATQLTMPLLMLHGADDHIAPWDSRLADALPASRCTLRRYAGARHNLFIERAATQVFADLRHWLAALPA